MKLRHLKGFGPKSEEILAKVNINNVDDFMAIDPFELYKQLTLKVKGTGLNSIYAIIGAREDKHWQEVSRHQKTEILLKLDDMGLAPKAKRKGGENKTFMSNNEFRESVWFHIASIPYGRVATYGQISALAGYPKHARAVGALLKKLPSDTKLPWFRVLNAKGRLSFPEHSEKFTQQFNLLVAEGIEFHNNALSLKRFQW